MPSESKGGGKFELQQRRRQFMWIWNNKRLLDRHLLGCAETMRHGEDWSQPHQTHSPSSLIDISGKSALPGPSSSFRFYFWYLFIWLCEVLVAARRIFHVCCNTWTLICSTWVLAPWPGIEPRSLVLGVWSLSPWNTSEVPEIVQVLMGCRWHGFSHLPKLLKSYLRPVQVTVSKLYLG